VAAETTQRLTDLLCSLQKREEEEYGREKKDSSSVLKEQEILLGIERIERERKNADEEKRVNLRRQCSLTGRSGKDFGIVCAALPESRTDNYERL